MKTAVRKKEIAYMKWLQMKTLRFREEYVEAKTEAKRIVRKAQNEEWTKLGIELEDDFHKNQKKFWKSVKRKSNGNVEAKNVCEESGDVIGEDKRVVER